VLSVLAAAAEEQPVLVIVDDVHWLDAASLEALQFAAHRLAAEGVVVLLGLRIGEALDPRETGLPLLRVGGLELDDARELLESTAGHVAASVSGKLLATAQGNPLALVEIPRVLSAAQLTGREELPSPLPPGASVEQAFERQIDGLSPAARSAVVVLSAMQTGRIDVLRTVLAREDIPADALDEAIAAGLVRADGPRMEFRHPLLRAAVYHHATPPERREAHRRSPPSRRTPAGGRGTSRPPRWRPTRRSPPRWRRPAWTPAAAAARRRRGRVRAAAELSVDDEARARRQLEAARDLSVSAASTARSSCSRRGCR
jgi:hypothetical protein